MSFLSIFFLGFAEEIIVMFALIIAHHESVAPFIRRHGKKPTEFPMCCVLAIGFLRDYLLAKKLCSEQNVRPKWLARFKIKLIALAIIASGILAFLFWAGPRLTN
jgi:hypothetical protein